MQWILTSAGTPRPVPTAKASGDSSSVWAWENTLPRDAEAVQAARAKQREPLLLGVMRLGVTAQNKAQSYALFGRVWSKSAQPQRPRSPTAAPLAAVTSYC